MWNVIDPACYTVFNGTLDQQQMVPWSECKIKECVCVLFGAGLRFLVRLCTDMQLKEAQDYATKLKKVEKMKEIREQVFCQTFLSK